MQYLFLLFTTLFLVSCAETTNTQTAPEPSTYSLQHNEDTTAITGEITFDLGNIPSNHTITLSNFTPRAKECSVDLFASKVNPESLLFTASQAQQSAAIEVKFFDRCDAEELTLTAEKQEITIINGKSVTNNSEVSYTYTLSKVTTTSSYKPVLKNSTLEVTRNKQNETITVSLYDELNRPASEGTINTIYPSLVTDGVDVGAFSETSVDVKSGVALFSYTAPDDLKKLLENNITQTSFTFYYNDALSSSTTLKVLFSVDANQTVIKNYALNFKPQNSEYKMSLEESKSFSISLTDDANNIIDESQVQELNITLENSFIAQMVNFNGEKGTAFHFSNKNNITLTLQSKTKSGLVPIHVSSSFIDINGESRFLEKTFNVIVESGPPTAISISYSGTQQDKDKVKFIEHFAVSVTDKYFNPINTNPQVSVGAIIGYAKYSNDYSSANTDNRIYVDTTPLATLSETQLDLNQPYLQNNTTVDPLNDTLVTFGNGYRYPASGAWDFVDFDDAHIYLDAGQYSGETTDSLGYAIGHNYRQDVCNFGDEWVGQTKLQNDASTIDDSGTAIIELSYDYYLVGKDIVLYINIIGKDNKLNKEIKIGEVKKHTLRGNGLEFVDDGAVEIPAGTSYKQKFFVWIKNTTEAYRNANFVFGKIDASDGCRSITQLNTYNKNACNIRNGQAYVEFDIVAKDGDCNDDDNTTECTGCSITVSEPKITDEF